MDPADRDFEALKSHARLMQTLSEVSRAALEEDDLGPAPPVTVSIGAASAKGSGLQLAEFFGAADEALYRAKRLGRNRVETVTLGAVGPG